MAHKVHRADPVTGVVVVESERETAETCRLQHVHGCAEQGSNSRFASLPASPSLLTARISLPFTPAHTCLEVSVPSAEP